MMLVRVLHITTQYKSSKIPAYKLVSVTFHRSDEGISKIAEQKCSWRAMAIDHMRLALETLDSLSMVIVPYGSVIR